MSAIDTRPAAGKNYNGKLKGCGCLDAHDAPGIEVLCGENARAFVLDVEHAPFQLANRCFECGQSFAAEQLGLLRELLQIRHRLFAVKIAGGKQLHRQGREYVSYRSPNRQGAGLFVQTRERVIELNERRWKILAPEFYRGPAIEQVLPVQLVNLLVGETAQRRAQHADQSQTVMGILHRAE